MRLPALLATFALTLLASATRASEPTPTWVFFADKDLEGPDLWAALGARATALAPRALARRQRLRGDEGVDMRDLELPARYVAGVLATGATLRARSRWLNAVSVRADAEQRLHIEALPYVAGTRSVARRARPERTLHGACVAADCPSASSAARDGSHGVAEEQLALLGIPTLHDCGLDGSGVVIGVQDTGFSRQHQAFVGLDVLAEHDFIHDDDVTADEVGDPAGQHDHGTSVLGLLAGLDGVSYAGVAPEVTVILSKTEDISQEQPIEEDWWIEGLEWIEAQGADLMTASLGYLDWYSPEDMDGQTALTSVAASVAVENGLILVNAAGNEGPGPTSIIAPADVEGVISVGAVGVDGQLADFSSRGPTADGRIKPDVCAVGVNNWVVDPATTDGYAQGSGTSYAAPMIAGLAALLLQAFPELTPAEMHALLTSHASQATTPDNSYGYGIASGPDSAGLYCTCHDGDEDHEYDAACGGIDCDDTRADIHPGATEICNGVDDDCDELLLDGELDEDGDSILGCAGDCDDTDERVNPGAAEVCDDETDNDCDQLVDGDDPDCAEPEPPDASVPTDPPDASGAASAPPAPLTGACDCRLGGRAARPLAPWPALGVAVVLWRRRRRTSAPPPLSPFASVGRSSARS